MFNVEETVEELWPKSCELFISMVEEATDKLLALVGELFKPRPWEFTVTSLPLDCSSAIKSRRWVFDHVRPSFERTLPCLFSHPG